MDFLVLGPLELRLRANPATPTARKHQQLLSLLLLNADHTVGVDDLIRGLWDNTPPQSAHITLQSYVAHLRKQIADGLDVDMSTAKSILVTTGSGYLFRTAGCYFDLHEYHRLRREGVEMLTSGNLDQAFESFRKALSHWRGHALADVHPSRVLAAEINRLEESRLRTVEQYLDTGLRLGRDREHLDELSHLCFTHPLHENFHLANMVALYRCGLRSDALRIFRRLRDETVRQLGLDPTLIMQRLHEAVLRSDDELLRVSADDPFGVSRSVLAPRTPAKAPRTPAKILAP